MTSFIYNFFMYLIEYVILCLYCQKAFQPTISATKRHAIGLLSYCCLSLIFLCNIPTLNMLSFFFVNAIYIKLCYDSSISISAFHALILTLIMTLSEAVIILFFPSFLIKNYRELNISMDNEYIAMILSKLVYLLITNLICLIWRKQNDNQVLSSNTIVLSAVPFITLIISDVIVSVYLNYNFSPVLSNWIIFSLFLLLLLNVITFSVQQYNQSNAYRYSQLQQQLQREHDFSEYYKALVENNNKERILIHDIRNHLSTISTLNKQGLNDKLDCYMESLMNCEEFKKPMKVCNNLIINAIFSRYMDICSNYNISLDINIRNQTIDFVSDPDLTSIFCNLMDNAISAARLASNPYIEVSVSKTEYSTDALIKISNSCLINPFDKHGNLPTTKEDKQYHGFGLRSVRNIVSRYNGDIEQLYNQDKKEFQTIILLKN
ncbi:MAG: GHKL domain-containing protein [Eubacteriales bacterium]|nr:GHKL domain-containing protein [Eubacteriales bacterium]